MENQDSKKVLTFKAEKSLVARLDKFCVKHGTNRNVALRNLLVDALKLTEDEPYRDNPEDSAGL